MHTDLLSGAEPLLRKAGPELVSDTLIPSAQPGCVDKSLSSIQRLDKGLLGSHALIACDCPCELRGLPGTPILTWLQAAFLNLVLSGSNGNWSGPGVSDVRLGSSSPFLKRLGTSGKEECVVGIHRLPN